MAVLSKRMSFEMRRSTLMYTEDRVQMNLLEGTRMCALCRSRDKIKASRNIIFNRIYIQSLLKILYEMGAYAAIAEHALCFAS
eukprot:12285644-Karenia_brevis.AAC.1